MAIRRPVYIDSNTGELTRFGPADSVTEVDHLTVTNNTGGALVIGTPVYKTAIADEVAKADADGLATANVLGLVADVSIADAASGVVQTDGRLSATTTQWDAVTGETGGLTPGARYYLSAGTAGMLTQTAPSVDGNVIAPLIRAKSTSEAEISIQRIVVL